MAHHPCSDTRSTFLLSEIALQRDNALCWVLPSSPFSAHRYRTMISELGPRRMRRMYLIAEHCPDDSPAPRTARIYFNDFKCVLSEFHEELPTMKGTDGII
ncbi:predicted protein [Histoplasma capsulatum G186AR]|uniref:Uncharacterized protein n=1 Tax=Ajellomyces capsulatus (strain G186AR / H82 / ATCC MYA-2454 / RMSCC 2432) TaxID=447093 RepID=C0NPY8_AJECG|nr:uncharacterized protein HCBG_05218 [Histoplasma capsulatum G186AR]EEH06998.1 predicted protein [Histoplasma capsulatum G186AR]